MIKRRPLAVVALGGNALLRRGEPLSAQAQEANVAAAARSLAELSRTHRLAVTHGNGPQVGLLALQSESYRAVAPYPLDVLGAESEGMIGYLLDRHLAGIIGGSRVVTLLTQVIVDPDDPAFANPTKPIGPVYGEAAAARLAAERGWDMRSDGEWFRRVVPSPAPQEIVELETIRLLVEAALTVVCAGGGGIPVVRTGWGLGGVEAVIDKDATAALLAAGLAAELLVLLTDVDGVYEDWNTNQARLISQTTPAELATRSFAMGSMAPKVAAARSFVSATGRPAVIGALADAAAVVAGTAGTWILPDRPVDSRAA
jgi:carbamate kinase